MCAWDRTLNGLQPPGSPVPCDVRLSLINQTHLKWIISSCLLHGRILLSTHKCIKKCDPRVPVMPTYTRWTAISPWSSGQYSDECWLSSYDLDTSSRFQSVHSCWPQKQRVRSKGWAWACLMVFFHKTVWSESDTASFTRTPRSVCGEHLDNLNCGLAQHVLICPNIHSIFKSKGWFPCRFTLTPQN